MTRLEHKDYGSLGSEFVMHHRPLQPKRLVASFVVTATLSAAFKMHEMNINLLWILSTALFGALMIRLIRKVSKESLLVVPSIGVQVKTEFFLGHQIAEFFDKSCVKGIIINEAITMQCVISYLALLLTSSAREKNIEKVYPLFTHSWPTLKELIPVYQAVQSMYSLGTQELTNKTTHQTQEVKNDAVMDFKANNRYAGKPVLRSAKAQRCSFRL